MEAEMASFVPGVTRARTKVDLNQFIPPDDMNFVGGGNFLEIGNEFCRYFVEFAGLQPHERVLDVGSGIGRMALPLTQYLNEQGSYEGIDVVPRGIDWCRSRIEPMYPRFHFQLADIHNRHYTPNGRYRADGYRFPFPGGSFDFVFLTSVFTHLLPEEMENYLYESARVLKVGGRCLLTFFLLNRESLDLIEQKKTSLPFYHQLTPQSRIVNRHVPAETISYDEKMVLALLDGFGLKLTQPIHYGNWCARPRFLSYQDMVIVRKSRPLSLTQALTRTWSRWTAPARTRFSMKRAS
jgi:ubiquinone/menaquinone biosynthesis C-methylase UbiE